jgi:hypothetical protein
MRLSESRKVLPKGGATGVVEGASRQQVETWATEIQSDKKEMSGILTMVILEEGGSERRRGEKRVVVWRTCVGPVGCLVIRRSKGPSREPPTHVLPAWN